MSSSATGRRRAIAAVLVGLAAGFAGGIFGIGGGVVVVPGLVLFLRFDQHRAHATSVAAIVVASAAGLSRFAAAGAVDWPAAVPLAVGAAIGAISGSRIMGRIPPQWLARLFVAFVAFSAFELLFGRDVAEGSVERIALDVAAVVGLGLVGLAAGALSSLLGIGGGVVYVPALAAIFGMVQHEAQGTSLAAIVPTTIVAALAHGREGRVDWGVALWVSIGGLVGGLVGASVALALDEGLLRRIFAVFLVLIATRMLGRTRASAHR